jgi:hypothetical protein
MPAQFGASQRQQFFQGAIGLDDGQQRRGFLIADAQGLVALREYGWRQAGFAADDTQGDKFEQAAASQMERHDRGQIKIMEQANPANCARRSSRRLT